MHFPVLASEVVEYLNIQPEGTYIDATLGGGGHSEAILSRLTGGRLLAIDQDSEAVAQAAERLSSFSGKLILRHANFAAIDSVWSESGLPPANGLLADLGLSSVQLDDATRGFSFSRYGPLDMRMDRSGQLTAADFVNTSRETDLANMIFRLGEERHSRRIARAIMKARPIDTTTKLALVVSRAIPSRAGFHHLHPATRTFMALRLAVNREMENLETFLSKALAVLAPKGRLVIVSFHSLEDRQVKQTLLQWRREGRAQTLTRKPVRPSQQEIKANPRSRSAKLRAAEKAA